jgi:hypothetical protein
MSALIIGSKVAFAVDRALLKIENAKLHVDWSCTYKSISENTRIIFHMVG